MNYTLLDTKTAAARAGLKPGTFRIMRTRGGGPRFVKLGGRVMYRDTDIDVWIASRVVASTAEMSDAMRRGLTRAVATAE